MTVSDYLVPQWQGPPAVRALFTTRAVEVPGPRLRAALPTEPLWLSQVHGDVAVVVDERNLASLHAQPPIADAAVTRLPGVTLAVRTADCLPVLFADDAGTVVAVAHAGWRGLAKGVLETTVAAMDVSARRISAWIGPAIGATRFEVGADVRDAYCGDAACIPHFAALREGKWLADLVGLAKTRLSRLGVTRIAGGLWCTHSDAARFFSHRREPGEGRMALVAWKSST